MNHLLFGHITEGTDTINECTDQIITFFFKYVNWGIIYIIFDQVSFDILSSWENTNKFLRIDCRTNSILGENGS